MFRALPKLIVLAAIALVVIAILTVTRRGDSAPEPNIVYVNPNVNAAPPASPAP